jgi:hypothetical protein
METNNYGLAQKKRGAVKKGEAWVRASLTGHGPPPAIQPLLHGHGLHLKGDGLAHKCRLRERDLN